MEFMLAGDGPRVHRQRGRLGHADIRVTLNTYTHSVSQPHREAGQRLDRVFAQPAS